MYHICPHNMITEILLPITILFTAVITGGWIQKYFVRKSNNTFKMVLAFSAAYLLALSILHILPEVFSDIGSQAGWYILAGFFLQIILDYFSHGIEHGHAHLHSEHHPKNFLIGVMAALWVHAFIEGMPFGGGLAHHHNHHEHGNSLMEFSDSLLLGISVHKLTEGFVVASLLRSFHVANFQLVLWMVAFALIAPLGAIVNHSLIHHSSGGIDTFTSPLLAVLVGIMLHVSTIILFENDQHHKFNFTKLLVIILGIASAAWMA